MSRAFAGGMKLEMPMLGEGALYAANLTSHAETGIGSWSDDELIASIKQMKKRDGSIILGPMAMYQRGWYALPDDDINAIVAFMRRKFRNLYKEEFVGEGLQLKDRWAAAGTLRLAELQSGNAWLTLGWQMPADAPDLTRAESLDDGAVSVVAEAAPGAE